MRNTARPQADPTAAHADQRDRAARLRDTAGRFAKSRDNAPSAPELAALPAPQKAPSRGTVPVAADAPEGTYALEITGEGLGLHADPGAALIVAPEMPTGAGLAVFYLKDKPAPVVFDLTHHFQPEFAKPFKAGSEVMPLIEVVEPSTGRVGHLSTERVEQIHRVLGIYRDVDLPSRFGPRPPKLPVMSECPEGMGEHYVSDAGAYPLVRKGETVVFDPSRRELMHGTLCVIEWHGGTRDVVLIHFREIGGQGEPQWWVDPVNRVGAGTVYTSDGPYDADHLRQKLVGTVVGVLVPRRERYEPEPIEAAEPASDETEADEATEDNDDTELRRLGRLFETARAREVAACRAINEAQDAAEQREPARPGCLSYRAGDHSLSVYGWLTHPEALEGVEIQGDDVNRLRRKMPMMREVLRPIRQGERAHIDHPGKRFDIVPHPEAQARAEEIVTACDEWRAEIERIRAEHITPEMEAEAEEAGGVALRLAEQIADLSAHTATGLRIKLRALCHFDPASWMRTSLPELPDPDQRLCFSLRQDIERDAEADADEPVTAESAASLGFEAYSFDTPIRSPREWMERLSPYTIGLHLADRFLRMGKPELVAFMEDLDGRDPEILLGMLNAVRDTRDELKALADIVGLAHIRLVVAGSSVIASSEVKGV